MATPTQVIVVETYARWRHLQTVPGIVEQGQDLYDEVSGVLYISTARAWQWQ